MFKRFSRRDTDLLFPLGITVIGLFYLLYRASPLLALALVLAAIVLYLWKPHQLLRKGGRSASRENPEQGSRDRSGA